MNKLDHRQRMKVKLSSLDGNAIKNKSVLISKNLARLLEDLHVIQKKLCIGAFAPIDHEPLWSLALSETLPEVLQGQLAFPVFESSAALMTFRLAKMSDLIVKEDFGFKILGPKDDCPEIKPDVILVPGLAFTKKGDRLGRGKGFYDKYLGANRGVKVGICFSLQLEELIPIEEHDVVLDYIVTEDKIINCKLA